MENPIKYSDLIVADDSITKLIEQLKSLLATYDSTAEGLKKQATELAAKMREVNGATEEGRQAIRSGATDADKLAKAMERNAFAQTEAAKEIAKLNEETRQLNMINKLAAKAEIDMGDAAKKVTKDINLQTASYNKLSSTYSLMKIRLNAMEQAGQQATEAYKKLAEQSKQVYQRMDELQRATGKYSLNVGNYENSILSALGANNKFTQSIVALGRSEEGSVKGMQMMTSATKAFGQTLYSLMANPAFLAIAGVAGAVATFKWWYDYNNGIKEATKLTMEFTEMGIADAKQFRDEISGVADVFGQEFKPMLQTVDTLVANFGIGWRDALKVVQDGLVAGADINGDFLSKLQRYSPYFQEAGVSARQFAAIVAQTRSGIFTDKGLDAIKMAINRIREMGTNVRKTLDEIGLGAEQVQKDLQTGAMSVFDVLQQISARLAEMPDNAYIVGETLKNVFGKKGADAGLALVRSLKDINTNLDEVKEKTGELGRLNEELIASETALNMAISHAFDMTGGSFETLTTKAKVWFNSALTWLVKIADTISIIIGFIGGGFSGASSDEQLERLRKIGDVWRGNAEAVEEYNDEVKKGVTTENPMEDPDVVKNKQKEQDRLAKAAEAAYKKRLEVRRKYEDAMLALETDEFEKREQQAKYKAEREIEDLRHYLDITKDLSTTERETINLQIVAIENQLTETLAKIESEREKKLLEMQNKAISLRLKGAVAGSVQQRELLKQQNEVNRQIALLGVTDSEEELAINQEFYNKRLDIDKKYYDDKLKAAKTSMKNLQSVLKEEHEQRIQDLRDKEKENEQFKQGMEDAYQFAIGQVQAYMDKRVEMAQQQVQQANTEVQVAQQALAAELEAKNAGYASNVEMARKELALAKENQKKALAEQAKAQKEQLAMQAITQAADLVSASAKIWAQLGFPWAIPAIAVMWGSFAAAKIKALQMTKSSGGDKEEYGEGTVELLEGGSHQSGNDIDLGRKKDGTRRRAEGGEYFAVINKRSSRKYGSMIPSIVNALNAGNFAEKYMNAFPSADAIAVNVIGHGTDISGLSADVRRIKEQGERRVWTDAQGNQMLSYKNLTRRVIRR